MVPVAPTSAGRLLNVHTVAGVLALAAWVVFLFADDQLTTTAPRWSGIIALALWWIVVLAGLLILVRWMPTHGKHAATASEDSWSEGPGLSVLAHVGMLVGVLRVHLRLPHLRRLTCARISGPRGTGRDDAAAAPARAPVGAAGTAAEQEPAVNGRRVVGESVNGRDIVAYHLGEPGRAGVPTVVLIVDDARQRAGHPAHPVRPQGRPARGGDRPVDRADVQPRRAGGGHPQERARRRPQPQLPLPVEGPRRQLRVRAEAGVGAGDQGDDALPARDPPRLRAELPPAAARGGHRHQAPEVRPPGRRQAEPARARPSTADRCATAR